MEIILAIMAATAVVLFGALISIGNERQRKAIDHLREQVVFWAVQDIRIKRESLMRSAKVDEPLSWLNKIASRIAGEELDIQVTEVISDPSILVCHDPAKNNLICFCGFSPAQMRKLSRFKRSRLTLKNDHRSLFLKAAHSRAYEISILNGGILFDIELPLAWRSLTGTKTDLAELWMYVVDQ